MRWFTIFLCNSWSLLDFHHFFLILLSWLRNHVRSQQQKNKVRFGSSLRGGVVGGSVRASSFGWFLLVEGDFGWFQVVCCFSSYISFTAYRTFTFLLYSWSHVIDWGHSIFLFKVKQQEKNYCYLVAEPSENNWLLPIFYCVLCQIKTSFKGNFLKRQSENIKQVGVLRNTWDEEFWRGPSEKISKNREIIRTHRETGRNELKWGDLPVAWRETASL